MKPEVKWIMDYLDEREIIPEMDRAINMIYHWTMIDFKYQSKRDRIAEWNPSDADVYAILCHILIGCFIHGELNYQAMIGYIANDIKCNEQIDRIKTAAEVIALAYQCGLIEITKNSDVMTITTEFTLDDEIPDFEYHQPESRPYEAVSNQILGCRFKQHDEDTCTEHINIMNKVPLTLEWRVINDLAESTDSEDIDFVRRSKKTYDNIGTKQFYLKHHYDTRGRVYCQGYYVNYQGSSYKKAIVSLANKELIEI